MSCRTVATTERVVCKQCRLTFTTHKSAHAQFCSMSCAITARNLTDQNPSYHRDVSGKHNPMYGKGLRGKANGMYGKKREQNPNWKGGRKVRADGYVLVMAPDHHPHAISSGRRQSKRYILEHRLVMERHLARYLDPKEVVHHINGNPSDNRIKNLRLHSSQSAHVSQEHPDLARLGVRARKH